MRIVVYVLLAVNLVYLAWAGWVDTPAPAPPPDPKSESLPQMALVSEGIARAETGAASASSIVPTAVTVAEPVVAAPTSSVQRCVSVGPFNDLTQAAGAATLLRNRGFDPRQRAEPGEMWDGYWVYVGGLDSKAAEGKVMQALERAGIKDARAMPASEEGRRVSVGLFSERDRAEKRAQAVKRLGYEAEITERRQAAAAYWIDMDLDTPDRAVPTEGLLSLEATGSRLEIRVCPSNDPAPSLPAKPAPLPRDALPAATTADAGVPRPG